MSYLGNTPGVSSQRITTTFTATSSQTTFTPASGYALGLVDVFLNGVKLVDTTDFTATNGTTVVLGSGATTGDIVETVAYLPRGLSDGYTKAEADAKYSTAAQGTLADSAVQPASTDTLTNKTIDSILNTVGADHIHFKVKATEAIAKGNVVKVTGYNSGENALEIAKVSSSTDISVGVAHDTLASGDFGAVINAGLLEGVDTSAFSVGDILYPNTSGGFTTTKPTSGKYQALAFVLRSHAVNGSILIEASEPNYSSGITAYGTSGQLLVSNGTGSPAWGTAGVAAGGTGLTEAGTSGNVLTSDGTAWVSQAPAASGISTGKAIAMSIVFGG